MALFFMVFCCVLAVFCEIIGLFIVCVCGLGFDVGFVKERWFQGCLLCVKHNVYI
jgi:hypothetical protein